MACLSVHQVKVQSRLDTFLEDFVENLKKNRFLAIKRPKLDQILCLWAILSWAYLGDIPIDLLKAWWPPSSSYSPLWTETWL